MLRNTLRNCDTCGNPYEAKSARSRFCSDVCRVRHARGAAPAPVISNPDPLVKATKAELEAAGRLDTALGQLALVLAARMSASHTTAGVAALSRELSRVAAAAIGSAPPTNPAPGTGDVVDEIKARRDAKTKA